MEILRIVRLTDTAKLPTYGTSGAAGMDLYADTFGDNGATGKSLFTGETIKVHTGIKMAIPEGYYLVIVPRSGLACKELITVVNSPGIIDSDYRGEIIVNLIKLADSSVSADRAFAYTLTHNDRIAQAILMKYEKPGFVEVDSLDSTERGESGFGSTGKN